LTIGGGTVLHIPRGRRLRDPQAMSFLEVQERGLNGDFSARAAALQALISSSAEGSTLADLVMRTGWPEEEIRKIAGRLAAEDKVRVVTEQPWLAVSPEVVASCVGRLVKEVERFHRTNPLAEAISKEDVRTRCASGLRP